MDYRDARSVGCVRHAGVVLPLLLVLLEELQLLLLVVVVLAGVCHLLQRPLLLLTFQR